MEHMDIIVPFWISLSHHCHKMGHGPGSSPIAGSPTPARVRELCSGSSGGCACYKGIAYTTLKRHNDNAMVIIISLMINIENTYICGF